VSLFTSGGQRSVLTQALQVQSLGALTRSLGLASRYIGSAWVFHRQRKVIFLGMTFSSCLVATEYDFHDNCLIYSSTDKDK